MTRALKIRLAPLVVALAVTGCGPNRGAVGALVGPPPSLTLQVMEVVVMRADDALRAALAGLDTVVLASAFRGAALHGLQLRVERMRERGLRFEEQQPVRAVVFADLRAAEVVLQVEAEARMVTPDQPSPPWSAIERQWWARLGSEAGSWWVVDEKDLPPDDWRSAQAGA